MLNSKNKYLKSISESTGPKDIKPLLSRVELDSEKGIEDALVARCALRLDGVHLEKAVVESLKTLDSMVRDKKNSNAGYILGKIYQEGLYDQKQDHYRADEYLRFAAVSGCELSAYELGCMYMAGTGVNKDLHEARRWIELAAEKGELSAVLLLGKILLSGGQGVFGDIVPPDKVKAVRLLELAAKGGIDSAKELLVMHYVALAIDLSVTVKSPTTKLSSIIDCIGNVEWQVRDL